MGDRIIIDITDGTSYTPSFYGHWCGLRAVKVLNDLVKERYDNGMHSLFCNFIVEIMERRPQKFSYYGYNHGDAEGAADWDNYTWCFNLSTMKWTTTDPQFEGRELTIEESDEFVKKCRPCLYRECKCEEYGSRNCSLKYKEAQNL